MINNITTSKSILFDGEKWVALLEKYTKNGNLQKPKRMMVNKERASKKERTKKKQTDIESTRNF